MTRVSTSGALLVMALGLAGCASVPRESGFPDVREDVSGRAGLDVQWYRGAYEELQVAEAVDSLLADSLLLEEAVQIALVNNRRLQATYEELGVAQAAVVQAGLLANPIFGGDAVFPVEGGVPNVSLEVALGFLDVFYLPLRRAVAESAFEGAKLRVTGAVLDLAGAVRAAFYRTQADYQRLEMLRQVMLASSATYEAAERLHAAGNIPALDLSTERALYEQSRLAVIAAEAAVVESRERLNQLMGLWGPDTRWTIAGRLPSVPEEPEALEEIESRAVAASLDLNIARQEIETYGRRLGLARGTSLVPELEAGAAAEREEGEWKVGPTASLPIPLFDRGQARVAAARAELRRRQEAYYAVAVEVRSAARTARARMLTARRVAEHYQEVLLPLRVRITRETQLQYNAMQIGIFQLLQAKQQEIEAGRRYIDALEAYWTARIDLDLLLQGRISRLSTELSPGSLTAEPSEEVSREDH